ncbi:unnamed protein product [Paramecium pentaurelia]|uniref:Uncharacterized protein n=1 Tax=Paramecium pentaurelia TaxID=43138 RepID=A0A8S1VLQ6_9CILI|nr:unnamed protein product [Paramecium pentaurelia]
MNKGIDKKRTSSFNKQTINYTYDKCDTQQKKFYCPKSKKDVKNMISDNKLKSSYENTTIMMAQNVSLKNVLTELVHKSAKNYVKQHIKKTPSTSLHTPADFTIRKTEQQSYLMKQQQSVIHQQSQQTSYRSLLQHNKRNQWIDLINQKSSNYIQSDEISIIDYKTQLDIMTTNNLDWKHPYTSYKDQRNHEEISHIDNLEFECWKELLMNRLIIRQAK